MTPVRSITSLLAATLLLASASLAHATVGGVFQYAVPIDKPDGKEAVAYIWVPPHADRIRGILIGGQTVFEGDFVNSPDIRKACADEKLAIIQFFPSFDAMIDPLDKAHQENPDKNPERKAGEKLQAALNKIAESTGYKEIAVAPWFPYGHSVSTLWASRLTCYRPEHTFGTLLFKGGIDTWYLPAKFAGVPVLAIKGQFEEFGPASDGVLGPNEDRTTAWKVMRDSLIKLRAEDDHNFVSLLVEPGATHFAWNETYAPYVATFIRKSAQKRIPDWPVDAREPVACKPIDPSAGALSDYEIPALAHPTAAYKDFKGDPKHAFWHLDAELAKLNDAYHAGQFAKKPQFVSFADDKGNPRPVGPDMRLQLSSTWSGPDTLKFKAAFWTTTPRKYPPADEPVGHPDSPILFRPFSGSVEQIAPDTFRIRLDPREQTVANILAYHPGDATYRYCEQMGRIKLPAKLTKGKPQTITFPPLGNLKADAKPLTLAATSDSGLPVRFYIESGPARLTGDNTLTLTDLPARAAWPLKLTVVAYQYGSAITPEVQSAEPVKQTITISR